MFTALYTGVDNYLQTIRNPGFHLADRGHPNPVPVDNRRPCNPSLKAIHRGSHPIQKRPLPYTPSHQQGLGSSIVSRQGPLPIHPQDQHDLLLLRRLLTFFLTRRYFGEDSPFTTQWSPHVPRSTSQGPYRKSAFRKRIRSERRIEGEGHKSGREKSAMTTRLLQEEPEIASRNTKQTMSKATKSASNPRSVVGEDRVSCGEA